MEEAEMILRNQKTEGEDLLVCGKAENSIKKIIRKEKIDNQYK
jgi:hypothetical protein